MADKQVRTNDPSLDPLRPVSQSRRDGLLTDLITNTTNPSHSRILNAYLSTGTVQGAEQEFGKIIDEIVDEA